MSVRKESNPIKDLYNLEKITTIICGKEYVSTCTAFDFFLDFIGYTTDRNLKEQEQWEKDHINGARNYDDRNKIRNSVTKHRFKLRDVWQADQVFKQRERLIFGQCLVFMNNYSIDQIYEYIDSLVKD